MNKLVKKLLTIVLVFICFFVGIILGCCSNKNNELKTKLDKEYSNKQITLSDTNNELSNSNKKIDELNNQITNLNNYIKENSK